MYKGVGVALLILSFFFFLKNIPENKNLKPSSFHQDTFLELVSETLAKFNKVDLQLYID